MPQVPRRKNGFTLLEIVIVSGVFLLLIAVLLVNTVSLDETARLDEGASALISLSQLARERTLAAQGNNQWGVHVDVVARELHLFEGATWGGVAEDTYGLERGVSVVPALAGAGDEVVFTRLEGTTTNIGAVTFVAPSGETRVVTVFTSGETALAGTLPAKVNPDQPPFDTRHVHFDIPVSLNDANTMTLTFPEPDPDVVVTIDVQDNLMVNGGVFIYEGKLTVDGEEQVLRIVSHDITATTSLLSIRRDRMENTKALDVTLDTMVAPVATYTATDEVCGGGPGYLNCPDSAVTVQ